MKKSQLKAKILCFKTEAIFYIFYIEPFNDFHDGSFKKLALSRRKRPCEDLTVHFKKCRSSRLEVFSKKLVIKNFTKFSGKYLCQSIFFNKVAGLRPATLLKKRLWHSCFPENFVKFLRAPLFTEHLHIHWLLLKVNKLLDGGRKQKRKKYSKPLNCLGYLLEL